MYAKIINFRAENETSEYMICFLIYEFIVLLHRQPSLPQCPPAVTSSGWVFLVTTSCKMDRNIFIYDVICNFGGTRDREQTSKLKCNSQFSNEIFVVVRFFLIICEEKFTCFCFGINLFFKRFSPCTAVIQLKQTLKTWQQLPTPGQSR